MGFEPRGPAERLQAIGITPDLLEPLRKALDPGLHFDPIPAPGPHDWLAAHHEDGQTFDEFVRSHPNRPDKTRSTLYLQPLGEFPKDRRVSLDRLREFAAAFFSMKVEVLPPVDFGAVRMTTRKNPLTGNRQILTDDILRFLKQRLSPDALCLLGVTMEDLYPAESWNFVFGQALPAERVGVYSFARYDPAFYGQGRGKDYDLLMLRRSCKVLAHETGHMFGLAHCIYFRCVLNGSNHLEESDARPMRLCPVCLHKLQWSIGFDLVKRYAALARFYRRAGIDDEARWTAERLRHIAGDQVARLLLDTKAAP